MTKLEPKDKKVLLSLTNVKKYFPLKKTKIFQRGTLYVKANDGIDLNIYQGETFGLVGESGCGKSTLGRVLLQLLHQTDGRTMYYGQERGQLAPQYVKDTLKHLDKHVEEAKKLDKEREQVNKEYEALTNEKDRWSMNEKYNIANKKASDAWANIVKIIGGFIVCQDLDEVSKVFLREYEGAVNCYKQEQKVHEAQLKLDAAKIDAADESLSQGERKKAENQIPSLTEKITALKEEAEAFYGKRQAAQNEIEQLREKYKDLPGFMENEELLDTGIDLARLNSEEMRILRKDLQLIFQDPYSSLNPRMSVGQIIGEGLLAHQFFARNSEKMQNYIVNVMEKCGLAPYMLHRYPHQFSGGQRQRIGIARSLALNPKFIVCDEAVSALDVSIQSQVLNLLMDLKEQENLTYLFISHDLSVVKYVSDRIGVMYLGNIVELASAEELFKNPLHPYTEALLAAIPTTDVDAPKNIVPIEGDIPSPVNPPKGCKFHTRCKYCMEICTQVVPEYVQVGPEHFVSCHLRTQAYGKED